MKAASKSDMGKKRTNNEDSILIDSTKGIFLLADGMGGHQAGEVASGIAVREVYEYLQDKVDRTDQCPVVFDHLAAALMRAHDAIKEKAKSDLNLKGMGTTLVGMVTKDARAYICHVGDSRAYLIREAVQQITKDQTLGDYLVEKKIMRKEEVPAQKWHTLTQALGTSEVIVPELNEVDLRAGDMVMLCSDGLTDMLSDDEIDAILQSYRNDLEKATASLIEAANRNGGKDNISVILVRYD